MRVVCLHAPPQRGVVPSRCSTMCDDNTPSRSGEALQGADLFQSSVVLARHNANESRRLAKTVAASMKQAESRADLLAPLHSESKPAQSIAGDMRTISASILAIGDLLTQIEAEASRLEIARKRAAMLNDVYHAAQTALVARAAKRAMVARSMIQNQEQAAVDCQTTADGAEKDGEGDSGGA